MAAGMWEGAGEEDLVPSRVRADMVPGPGASNKELSLREPTDCAARGRQCLSSQKDKETKEFEKGFRRHSSSPGVLGEGDRQELNLRHRIT